jgi:hypothetical protein
MFGNVFGWLEPTTFASGSKDSRNRLAVQITLGDLDGAFNVNLVRLASFYELREFREFREFCEI